MKQLGLSAVLAFSLIWMVGCQQSQQQATAPTGITPQKMADALHTVLEADRTVYAKHIVTRLQNEEQVIKASEYWKDEKALILPAQMFRLGSELVQESGADFSYSLLSLWPINKQNKPKTDAEKEGLQFLADNAGKNFYSEETLGDQKYFVALYPDKAVAGACIACHNNHKDSPRDDFKMGEIMGGIAIRFPIQ